MALATGGSAAAGYEWRFVVPAGAVGDLEREVAVSLLNAHGAVDKRVSSACAALALTEDGNARVALSLLMAAAAFMVVFVTVDGTRRRKATHVGASAPAQWPVPLKTAPRRLGI